jgi:hypothetical protein
MHTDYSSINLDPIALTRVIGNQELAPYIRRCGNNLLEACTLYQHNLKIGSELLPRLHILEASLRNKLEREATKVYGCDWMDRLQIAENASHGTRASSKHSVKSTTVKKRVAPSDRSFGFWVSLLSQAHEKNLWEPAFKYLFGTRTRSSIHSEFRSMCSLRNMVAHNVCLANRNLTHDFTCINRLMRQLSES